MTLQRVVAACGIGKVANKPSLFPAVSSRGPKATAPPLHIAWTLQLNVVGQVHGHWPQLPHIIFDRVFFASAAWMAKSAFSTAGRLDPS